MMVVRLVEANLLETSTVTAQYLLQMHDRKKFDLENEGQSDGAQRLQWCHLIQCYITIGGCNAFQSANTVLHDVLVVAMHFNQIIQCYITFWWSLIS